MSSTRRTVQERRYGLGDYSDDMGVVRGYQKILRTDPTVPVLLQLKRWKDRQILWQDPAGTVPVKSVGDPIGRVDHPETGAKLAEQTTDADRIIWQGLTSPADASSGGYLELVTGVNDTPDHLVQFFVGSFGSDSSSHGATAHRALDADPACGIFSNRGPLSAVVGKNGSFTTIAIPETDLDVTASHVAVGRWQGFNASSQSIGLWARQDGDQYSESDTASFSAGFTTTDRQIAALESDGSFTLDGNIRAAGLFEADWSDSKIETLLDALEGLATA